MLGGDRRLGAVYRFGDTVSIRILGALLAGSLALSFWYDTWLAWALFGLPLFAVPALLVRLNPGAAVTRYAVAVAYMGFAALTIHQAAGMVEFHFSIFVLLAFLLVYRDSMPIIIAAVATAVHHLAFHHLQMAGVSVFLLDREHSGMGVVLIHAAFVVFEAAILVYLASMMRREALQRVELEGIARSLVGDGGSVDFVSRPRHGDSGLTGLLNGALDQVQSSLERTLAAFQSLSAIGGRMNTAAEDVAGSAQQQSDDISALAAAVTEMSTSVGEVAGYAGEMSTATGEGLGHLREVQGMVSRATSLIQSLERKLEGSSDQILRLEAQGEGIGRVLEVIGDVADRTNLLALNAAIEAARAGEHGRGFAVVADEVRQLARQTRDSTEEIEKMISDLREQTRRAAETMREGVTETAQGAGEMRTADKSLDGVVRVVEELERHAAHIASAAGEQSQVAQEIDQRLSSISSAAQKTHHKTDSSRADAEELGDLVNGMQQQLQVFRL